LSVSGILPRSSWLEATPTEDFITASVSSVVEIVLSSSSLTTDYTDATDKVGEAGVASHTVAWLYPFSRAA
jgi:hypothetical protein